MKDTSPPDSSIWASSMLSPPAFSSSVSKPRPPSHVSQLLTPQPPQKKRKRRKRHAPVGPAGAWFQAQIEQRHVGAGKQTRHEMEDGGNADEDEEAVIGLTQGIAQNDKSHSQGIVFYSEAWNIMQIELDFATPKLPAFLSAKERYEACRPHVPGEYTLIPEILDGQADWKLPEKRRLLVLVHSIESLADNLWITELLDETGSKILAWIQPKLVKQEQQRQTPKYIRSDMVWMLKNVTLLLDSGTNSLGELSKKDATLKRILLVGESNIDRVWAPPSYKSCSSDETSTPNKQGTAISDEKYIEWMERRNNITSSLANESEEAFFTIRDNYQAQLEPDRTQTLETSQVIWDFKINEHCTSIADSSIVPKIIRLHPKDPSGAPRKTQAKNHAEHPGRVSEPSLRRDSLQSLYMSSDDVACRPPELKNKPDRRRDVTSTLAALTSETGGKPKRYLSKQSVNSGERSNIWTVDDVELVKALDAESDDGSVDNEELGDSVPNPAVVQKFKGDSRMDGKENRTSNVGSSLYGDPEWMAIDLGDLSDDNEESS